MENACTFATSNPGWAFLIAWVAAWMVVKVSEALASFHPFARVVNHHHYHSECSCDGEEEDEAK